MTFFSTWIEGKRRRAGSRLTPQEMVAAKAVVNLLITESFPGVSLGQLNVASEYYYGTPEPADYDHVFDALCKGIEALRENNRT